VLGPIAQPVMEAQVLDASGSGLRLRVPWVIPCGAPVKVDAQDMLMLGEVTRCEPDQGAHIVGLHLSHSLEALAESQKLNRALLGEDVWANSRVKVRTRS
jgi:PilZ domain-containing protein